MAGLAFGFVGGMIGGPIGFMIGSAIGNMLFPGKGQDGPRLKDLHLQSSQYGKMIPIIYGTMRSGATVDWQTDLQEHKHTSGGKGGPAVTTYTYTASFSCKICEGPAIAIRRIWADGTIIYDTTIGGIQNLPSIPITIYLGTDTQLPDPTIEGIEGVGLVSGNRGYVYVVFTDWDLGNFGNRIPNLNFEVCTKGGDIPWRVSDFAAWPITLNRQGFQVTYSNGIITATDTKRVGTILHFYFRQYDLQGNVITAEIETVVPYVSILEWTVRNLNAYVVEGPGPSDLTWWVASTDPTTLGTFVAGVVLLVPPHASYPNRLSGNFNVYQNDRIYYVDSNSSAANVIGAVPAPAGMPSGGTSTLFFTLDAHYADSSVSLGTSDTGHLYVMVGTGGNCKLWKLDADLNLVHFWDVADTSGTRLTVETPNFHVYNSLVTFNFPLGVSNRYVALVKINGDLTLEDTGVLLAHSSFPPTSLAGGLGIDATGVYSLDPPITDISYGDIVADQSKRTGLAPSQYDTSDLPELVRGYTVDRQGPVRDNINILQAADFFDGVERAGKMVFVKRGKLPIVTIPDNDLATFESGGTPPPLVEVKRTQEVDLPATLNVSFVNQDNDYQISTQTARRLVTSSQATVTLQLPIALSNQKGSAIAWINLMSTWVQREPYTITLPRKYWQYEPTDVIEMHGYTMRTINKSDAIAGIIKLEGVAASTSVWIQGPVGPSGAGITPSTPPIPQANILNLLDIPLIADTDFEFGLYASIAATTTGPFGGATLFKSSDGGGTYDAVASDSVADVIGVTADALPNFLGGNVFDESSTVTVTIGAGGGTLASTDALSVLNGANLCLIGLELVQFKVADLTAPSTYVLSGLLRGRRGTEWAMPSHVAGELFAMLPVIDVDGALSELGQSRLYKAVSTGQTLGTTAAQAFTDNGAAARPYAPAQVVGAPVDPFDGTVQISWQRRTRVGGAWVDFVDVPLSEASEAYIVQVWDSTFANVARIISTTSPTITYTAAQQVTDFGATQLNVYVTIGQVGAYLLGTQTRAVIPGLGVSDDAVIAPIPPYNSSPPPTSPGCTLPTTTSSFVWAAPVSQFDPTAGPAETWVISFTTGSITAGAGSIQAAEYGGPPTQRDAVLSLSPCGAPLTPGSHSIGNTVSVIFYMQDNPYPTVYPTLLPATTYYFSINSVAPSGMICNLSTPH